MVDFNSGVLSEGCPWKYSFNYMNEFSHIINFKTVLQIIRTLAFIKGLQRKKNNRGLYKDLENLLILHLYNSHHNYE